MQLNIHFLKYENIKYSYEIHFGDHVIYEIYKKYKFSSNLVARQLIA